MHITAKFTLTLCFIINVPVGARQPDIAATLRINDSASSYQHVINALRTIPERIDTEQLLEVGSALAVHALTKPNDNLRTEFVPWVIEGLLAKHNLDKTFYTRSFDAPQWIQKQIPIRLRIEIGVKEFIASAYLLTQTASPLSCLLAYASPEPIGQRSCANSYPKQSLTSINEMLYANPRIKRFIPIYDYQLMQFAFALNKNIGVEQLIDDARDEIETISDNRINQNNPQTKLIRDLKEEQSNITEEIVQGVSSLKRLRTWEKPLDSSSPKLCDKVLIEPIFANIAKRAKLKGITHRLTSKLPFSDKDTKKINELKQSIAQLEQDHIIKDIGRIFGYNVVSSTAHAVAHTAGIDHNKLELLFAQDCLPKTNMQHLTKQMVTRLCAHAFDRFFEPSGCVNPVLRHFLVQRKQEICTNDIPDISNTKTSRVCPPAL